MPKASDIKPSKRFFGMFVSRSGDGKTCAGASFPNSYYFDTDMRMRGLLGVKHFQPIDHITYDTYPPKKGFAQIEEKLTSFEQLFTINQKPYDTIIMDSATTMLRLFVTDSHDLTQGKKIGSLRMSGPADFNYEQEAMMQVLDILRGLPCHVIVNAHIIDKFGKEKRDEHGKLLDYQESQVVGEKLSIRDKLGENILLFFDEVYRFSRSQDGHRHLVEFHSDVAKTAYSQLPWGKQDWTGKQFFPWWNELISKETPMPVQKAEAVKK